jgi:hypothetical protein
MLPVGLVDHCLLRKPPSRRGTLEVNQWPCKFSVKRPQVHCNLNEGKSSVLPAPSPGCISTSTTPAGSDGPGLFTCQIGLNSPQARRTEPAGGPIIPAPRCSPAPVHRGGQPALLQAETGLGRVVQQVQVLRPNRRNARWGCSGPASLARHQHGKLDETAHQRSPGVSAGDGVDLAGAARPAAGSQAMLSPWKRRLAAISKGQIRAGYTLVGSTGGRLRQSPGAARPGRRQGGLLRASQLPVQRRAPSSASCAGSLPSASSLEIWLGSAAVDGMHPAHVLFGISRPSPLIS